MPFAENSRGIALRLQRLGKRKRVERQAPALAGAAAEGALELPAEAVLVQSGEQRGAGRRAHRPVAVVIREAHPLGREPVDIRRAIARAAIATQIAVAEVVRENDDEVGTRARRGRGGDCRQRKPQNQPEDQPQADEFQSSHKKECNLKVKYGQAPAQKRPLTPMLIRAPNTSLKRFLRRSLPL